MKGQSPTVLVEQRVDYSRWASGGFGTVDCLAVSGDTLFVFDFKYGQGVEVIADRNPQLMCYALGGYEMFSPIFSLRSVVLNIYQPRREHVSVYSMSVTELLEWADTVLRPAAVLADAGEGEMNPGEWCRFCRVKATCRKLSEQNLELAKLDFPAPETLSPAEIGKILPKLDSLVDWAKALQDHALALAVGGQTVPGYKLVAGRSVRKFRSEADACLKIKAAGFNPYITKMKGITELQKDMGKKQFEEVCGGELIKPAGKPALVPLSDKRPELMTSAEADFAEE